MREEAATVAAHAAVAFAAFGQAADYRLAMTRRALLGQATGVVMERYQVDPARAFALLRRLSQDQNRKLYDLAEELVLSGRTTGIERPTLPNP